MKISKKLLVGIACAALAVVLACGGCALYVGDYYRADIGAIAAMTQGDGVAVTLLDGGDIAYGDADAAYGLIFYPGGKVEHTAYEPLLRALAAKGVLCVLIQMPLRLAVLDMDAAEGVREQFPLVEHWYIGGHSLGGSMAASYLSGYADGFEGLILLGSYSTADLSATELRTLSLFGSEDGVMNREKYAECLANLPADLTEIEIEGGCHAYFGTYGAQKGDGTPTLSARQQISLSADYVAAFMKGES